MGCAPIYLFCIKTNYYLYTALLVKSPSFLEEKFSVVRKRKTGLMNQTPTLEIAASLRNDKKR